MADAPVTQHREVRRVHRHGDIREKCARMLDDEQAWPAWRPGPQIGIRHTPTQA
jgi:hypothetical protein